LRSTAARRSMGRAATASSSRAVRGRAFVRGSRRPPATVVVLVLANEDFLVATDGVDVLSLGGFSVASRPSQAVGAAARGGAVCVLAATFIPRTRREKPLADKMLKVLSHKRLTTSDIFSEGGESELTLGGGGRYIQRRCGYGRTLPRPASHAAQTVNFELRLFKAVAHFRRWIGATPPEVFFAPASSPSTGR